MPVVSESSVRSEREWGSRLAWAFVFSMTLHALLFGGYYMGREFGLWQRLELPAWLRSSSSKALAELLKKNEITRQEEMPLIFVDVSSAQATPEPPKSAKYYSNKNSKAANPEPDKETEIPKIDGKRPELVKTEDVPKENFVPLQPTPPPLPQSKEPQEEVKSATTYKPGDLTMAKPDPNPQKDEGKERQPRRRPTVQEAKARLENRMAGQKMKQEGGVRHRLDIESLDAKVTIFGDYDWALVQAVRLCWYRLLDEQSYSSDYRGKVVLQFRLHQDGNITDLDVVENTAGSVPGLLCETAVEKPKPYEKFPADMRRVVGDIRNIRFTFYYD